MTHEFPDDVNGDVLRRMAADGVDLVSPRVMDFEHVFPDEASARRFSAAVAGIVLEVRVRRESGGWGAQCRQRMVPTYAAITASETRLAEIARRFGGFPDGWGSLSNPDGSPAE